MAEERKKRTATPTPTLTPTATPTPLPTATATPTPLPTDAPPRAGLGDAIDTYLNNLVAAKRFHGAVLVVHRGSVLLSRGYGPANIDTGAMNTANTRLRLASVTKQFTAMAVMQLVAAGKLGVDDPLCNYISDCPERWRAITIKHLLTHTHGLPNYTDFPSYEQTQMNPTTPEQLLEKLRGQWPVTEPGSTYAYGNSGYVLLGIVIEKVSGQRYGDFLRDHIFTPLGMHNSGVSYEPTPGENWALPYQGFSSLAAPLDTTTLFSAGAVYSTADDMYLWDQALYTEQLLPRAQLDEMFTPYLKSYGYGWKIVDDSGHLRYGHSGDMDGCKTVVWRYPADRSTIVVLSNMHSADSDAIAARIARMLFPK
ncbi:beta-lactamase family protein [Chloroflexia bacterium SDU3-3]|nr:beta-lactamase family protein [Chloroflexia bacterium SDU3-3]